jgi:hypothetical protein
LSRQIAAVIRGIGWSVAQLQQRGIVALVPLVLHVDARPPHHFRQLARVVGTQEVARRASITAPIQFCRGSGGLQQPATVT